VQRAKNTEEDGGVGVVKLVFCCRRRPELTREQFQAYWLDSHGPLVRSLHEALPQMRRYVQSHTLITPANDAIQQSRGTDEPFDGITEVWFDSLEAMGSTTEEATAAGHKLLEDESTFIDFAASSVFLTVEHEIF
jgi:uncharacterized protein (TIGR02118 family)